MCASLGDEASRRTCSPAPQLAHRATCPPRCRGRAPPRDCRGERGRRTCPSITAGHRGNVRRPRRSAGSRSSDTARGSIGPPDMFAGPQLGHRARGRAAEHRSSIGHVAQLVERSGPGHVRRPTARTPCSSITERAAQLAHRARNTFTGPARGRSTMHMSFRTYEKKSRRRPRKSK